MTAVSMTADSPASEHSHELEVGDFSIRDPGRYIPLPTGKKMSALLERCKPQPPQGEQPGRRGLMGLITGAPGSSKTETALHFRDAHCHCSSGVRTPVAVVSASAYKPSPAAILEAIVEEVCGYGYAYRVVSLIKHVQRELSGGLLIVDEAHHLDARALDGLRSFNDECGIGIVYIGNEEVVRRISGRGRGPAYAQIRSRIGIKMRVSGPSQADVDALLAAWGVADREAVKFGREVGLGDGGLRTLTHVLRQAEDIANAKAMPNASLVQLMRTAAKALEIV